MTCVSFLRLSRVVVLRIASSSDTSAEATLIVRAKRDLVDRRRPRRGGSNGRGDAIQHHGGGSDDGEGRIDRMAQIGTDAGGNQRRGLRRGQAEHLIYREASTVRQRSTGEHLNYSHGVNKNSKVRVYDYTQAKWSFKS